MLYWAIVFFIVALVAAVFGFGGIAGESAWIAQILLFIFLVLAVVSLLTGRRPRVLRNEDGRRNAEHRYGHDATGTKETHTLSY